MRQPELFGNTGCGIGDRDATKGPRVASCGKWKLPTCGDWTEFDTFGRVAREFLRGGSRGERESGLFGGRWRRGWPTRLSSAMNVAVAVCSSGRSRSCAISIRPRRCVHGENRGNARRTVGQAVPGVDGHGRRRWRYPRRERVGGWVHRCRLGSPEVESTPSGVSSLRRKSWRDNKLRKRRKMRRGDSALTRLAARCASKGKGGSFRQRRVVGGSPGSPRLPRRRST
jgi:hypothetical protein